VSDLGLPGTDGFDLLRTIRREAPQELRAIPAIAVSAFVRPEDRARAIRAGFEMHIAKPANPADVVRAVRQLMH
jgi:CheY-like chemotaxis protein